MSQICSKTSHLASVAREPCVVSDRQTSHASVFQATWFVKQENNS